MRLTAASLCLPFLLMPAACATTQAPDSAAATAPDPVVTAKQSIDAADLLRHTSVLASDAFEGRAPATPGEEKTVAYLTEQFRAVGLQPGNPDGTYVQDVPLVGITGTPEMTLKVGGRRLPLKPLKDFVATTARFVPSVEVKDSELVFVGYGVQAPEYDWDDYKGLDVKGKTLVMLINDPAIPDPQDPSQLDEAMFRGKAMTYYGRWTYKYEIAARLGAAGAIIVHETEPAAYPWTVVENSWGGEQFELAASDRNLSRLPVQAWITRERAVELFSTAGQDFEALKRRALQRDFQPVTLKHSSMTARIRNQVREVASRNVLGAVPGSDPALKHQWIVYTAHWDHLGRNASLDGDSIYNGAVDNATGTAALIEIAQAFNALGAAPRRSILFLAVTAEEQGLLGSRHYASHPLYPLEQTVANINMDALAPWGPTTDLQVMGHGQNTLETVLEAVAKAGSRRIVPDQHPEKGSYYRSDQFEFAKRGVPALYARSGIDIIGRPGHGEAMQKLYTANDYHKPSDEVRADWDLSGIAQDLQLLFEVGYRVAQDDAWPQWKDGSEFKAIREAALTKRRAPSLPASQAANAAQARS
jgi:Zn-dependent M28 family amino/carboxypeptidase